MTYDFLQHYWCFIVSLLGALLVFLLFVQGANSVAGSLGGSEEGRRLVYNSTGRKWEFTFTTLVTFGGAFFASFPLFYSTSFGGAYWLWMIILFTFVLQAVSYEFQNKLGNLLGPKTFQFFLTLNGILGPLLLGGAVATFFEGSNFIVEKNNMIDPMAITPVISRWANASHGLDALLNPWVLVFGFAVVFLARVLGILYVINNVASSARPCPSCCSSWPIWFTCCSRTAMPTQTRASSSWSPTSISPICSRCPTCWCSCSSVSSACYGA